MSPLLKGERKGIPNGGNCKVSKSCVYEERGYWKAILSGVWRGSSGEKIQHLTLCSVHFRVYPLKQ